MTDKTLKQFPRLFLCLILKNNAQSEETGGGSIFIMDEKNLLEQEGKILLKNSDRYFLIGKTLFNVSFDGTLLGIDKLVKVILKKWIIIENRNRINISKICWIVMMALCIFALFPSCSRNYKKECDKLIDEYKSLGKDIIARSDSNLFFIYADSNAFWIKDLDNPTKKILSADMDLKGIQYWMSFTGNGKPYIKPDTFYVNLSPLFFQNKTKQDMEAGDAYPYNKSSISIFNNEAIIFTYRCVYENPRSEILEPYEEKYVYYLSNPNIIFKTNDDNPYNSSFGRSDNVRSYVSNLAFAISDYSFPYIAEYNKAEGGLLNWRFWVNSRGEITDQDNVLEYTNEMYENVSKKKFNISHFSSKDNTQNILLQITQTVEKEEQAIYLAQIQPLIDNSVTLEQLSKEYRNTVKFDRTYKNQFIYLDCQLEFVKEVTGWFEPEYKYKVISSSVMILGQWISDYDLTGYTNDENFINLTYPHHVVMKARVTSASSRVFKFSDCELLYAY